MEGNNLNEKIKENLVKALDFFIKEKQKSPEIKLLPVITGIVTFLLALSWNEFIRTLLKLLPSVSEILVQGVYTIVLTIILIISINRGWLNVFLRLEHKQIYKGSVLK